MQPGKLFIGWQRARWIMPDLGLPIHISWIFCIIIHSSKFNILNTKHHTARSPNDQFILNATHIDHDCCKKNPKLYLQTFFIFIWGRRDQHVTMYKAKQSQGPTPLARRKKMRRWNKLNATKILYNIRVITEMLQVWMSPAPRPPWIPANNH